MSVNNVGVMQNVDVTLNKENYKKINSQQEQNLFNIDEKSNSKVDSEQTQGVSSSNENKKISFEEGLKLFGEGAWNKIKEMGTAIIEHPGKTLLAVGITTAAMAALPLIGISAATGAAVGALVFGGIAIANTTKDIVETVDDYKDGRYDEVREDIQDLGGDGVDLALSLPFMPKAFKQVSKTVKYGRGTIGLNKELIKGLKGASSVDDVVKEFGKANVKINYEQISNEMGLKTKPELQFRKDMLENVGAEFEPTTGKVYYNENNLSLKKKIITPSNEKVLRHELEHFKQFETIAKVHGSEGVKATMTEYYSSILGDTVDMPNQVASLKNTNSELHSQNGKLYTERNAELRKQISNLGDDIADFNKKSSELKFGQTEKIEIQNTTNYDKYDDLSRIIDKNVNELEMNSSSISNLENSIKNKNTFVEKSGVSSELARNMTSGDKSMFNQGFWDDVVNNNGGISTNIDDIAKADAYRQGIIEKVIPDESLIQEIIKKYDLRNDLTDSVVNPIKYEKAKMEIYKSNILEKEAYAAGDNYQMIGKATKVANGLNSINLAKKTFEEDDVTLWDAIKNSLSWNKWRNLFN